MCVCVCVFLSFYISVDFRVPLADPLGQIGSILDRFGYHCLSNFPAFSAARAELLQRLRKKLRKKLAENLQGTSKKLTRNAKNLQRTSNKLMQRTFSKAKSQAAYSIDLLVFFGIIVESQKYVGQIQGYLFTSSGHAFRSMYLFIYHVKYQL